MKSAVCLIVRNEARDIAEWMAYHKVAGFDTQIIFDNRSDDGTTDIIKAAATELDIRFHHWPHSGPDSQVAAYEAACAAYKLEFDWIAFVDSDEFVVIAGETVNAYLARFEGWSGVALNWAIYGSDGHTEFPPGLVLESFTRRARPDFFPTRHVKSIVRPGFVARCLNPHCFDLRGNHLGSYATPKQKPMHWWPAPELGGILPGVALDVPDYGTARVNHYFTRSRAHWLAKLKRGYPSDIAIRKLAEFDEYDRNDAVDAMDQAVIEAVRASAKRIASAASRLNNS